MILDTKKSFRIAPIDCSATTLDSSHDESGTVAIVGLVVPAAMLSGSGVVDGGVSEFWRTYSESVSSSGNVTFHTHSSHVSRLSVAPYSCSVLNNVWIAPIRTSGRASAHRPSISSRRCIHSALYAGSCAASRRLACIASETHQKRLSAAVSAMFVSACRPNWPRVLMQSRRCSGESAASASHMSVMHWNAILISEEYPFSCRYPAAAGARAVYRGMTARTVVRRQADRRSRAPRKSSPSRRGACVPTPAGSGGASRGPCDAVPCSCWRRSLAASCQERSAAQGRQARGAARPPGGRWGQRRRGVGRWRERHLVCGRPACCCDAERQGC